MTPIEELKERLGSQVKHFELIATNGGIEDFNERWKHKPIEIVYEEAQLVLELIKALEDCKRMADYNIAKFETMAPEIPIGSLYEHSNRLKQLLTP